MLDEPKDDRKAEEKKPAAGAPAADSMVGPEAASPEHATAGSALPSASASASPGPEPVAPGPSPNEAARTCSSASFEPGPPQAGKAAEVEIPLGVGEERAADDVRAAFEHPWAVRFCHWLNAVSTFVLITSGLRIFRAFPSFGPKVPQQDLVDVPKALTLGGWLGGALRWHFTFMWIFAGTGVLYLAYQVLSGHYKTVLFRPRDAPGVWPMVRHYFLFGPQPPVTEQYNPLQKLAYTSTVLFGVASVLTGTVIYKPVQFWWLAKVMGGFHLARVWHFAAMCGFLAFIPGHLIMVVLHGWKNFASMLTGWKRDPGYPVVR
jgi:Ni/Fe-hydrogenase b-type cytochrome subunit